MTSIQTTMIKTLTQRQTRRVTAMHKHRTTFMHNTKRTKKKMSKAEMQRVITNIRRISNRHQPQSSSITFTQHILQQLTPIQVSSHKQTKNDYNYTSIQRHELINAQRTQQTLQTHKRQISSKHNKSNETCILSMIMFVICLYILTRLLIEW